MILSEIKREGFRIYIHDDYGRTMLVVSKNNQQKERSLEPIIKKFSIFKDKYIIWQEVQNLIKELILEIEPDYNKHNLKSIAKLWGSNYGR